MYIYIHIYIYMYYVCIYMNMNIYSLRGSFCVDAPPRLRQVASLNLIQGNLIFFQNLATKFTRQFGLTRAGL